LLNWLLQDIAPAISKRWNAMNHKIYLTILFATAITFAQKPDFDFIKANKDAARLIYSKPDSALVIVKKMLSQKGSLHDTIYGNSYYLYGIFYTMKGVNDSAVYYQKKALSYFNNYPISKGKSLLKLSIAYRDKADYKMAIKCLNEGLDLAKKNKDNIGIAMAYGELASNYTYMLEFDTAIDYLLKSLAILKAEKNTKKMTPIKQKLGNTYYNKKNYKFAIDMYRECLAEFKQQGNMKNYYITAINYADAFTETKEYGNAKSMLIDAAKGMETIGDKALTGVCYAKIGKIEHRLGHYKQAVANYKKGLSYLIPSRANWVVSMATDYIEILNGQKDYTRAIEVIKSIDSLNIFSTVNLQDRMNYNHAAAEAYDGARDNKKAIAAYRRTIEIQDSISESEKSRAIEEVQAKFQTELQREKNVVLEANNKMLKREMEIEDSRKWLLIIARFSVLTVILLILRSYWLKTRLQKETIKTVEAEKSIIQQHHSHEQELTNAQREIIDEKQRELTSTALRMANYQDAVNEIIEKCNSGSLIKISEVKKELQQLVKQQDYWKQFETRFNTLHPDFGVTLTHKYNKLTKNDIEFCSLLKLNLSNKEIASLLQISHESAITKKYRIKKKMEINDDDEFEKLLMGI